MAEEAGSPPDPSAPSILVMIPTYNDFELLGDIVKSIRAELPNSTVLVINDGSDEPIFRNDIGDECLLVGLKMNMGLGLCMHVAFDHFLRYDYDVLARVDSDGQHPVGSLTKLVQPILQGKASYVVGCRSNRNESRSMRAYLARFVRGYMAFIVSTVTRGWSPEDITSGFIAADRKTVQHLNRQYLERYPEPQMSLAVGRQKLPVESIEIEQLDRAHGVSTITVGQALRFLYRFNINVLAALMQKGATR